MHKRTYCKCSHSISMIKKADEFLLQPIRELGQIWWFQAWLPGHWHEFCLTFFHYCMEMKSFETFRNDSSMNEIWVKQNLEKAISMDAENNMQFRNGRIQQLRMSNATCQCRRILLWRKVKCAYNHLIQADSQEIWW